MRTSRSSSIKSKLQLFPSPSFISFTDDSSSIVKITKVSPAIKAKLGKKKLFQGNPPNVPRLRKSAVLRCFGQNLVASTPIISGKPESQNSNCFISPITPIEYETSSTNSVVATSKSKKASLKIAIKTFNEKIKEEKEKIQASLRNTSVQMDEETYKSKIQESLKIDDNTTEQLQTNLFKRISSQKRTTKSKSPAEHDDVFVKPQASKYVTRQTQTSNSLISKRKFSQNNSTNEGSEVLNENTLQIRMTEVECSVNVISNQLDLSKGDRVNNSVITISDISVSEVDKNTSTANLKKSVSNEFQTESIESDILNVLKEKEIIQLEENSANKSMIFYELPIKENIVEASNEIVPTDNNNEFIISRRAETLVLSHLNLETEIKEIDVVEKIESVPTVNKYTPLKNRLRNRGSKVETKQSMILPRLATNKRKCQEGEDSKAKKQSPEVLPSKEVFAAEKEQISKPQEKSMVQGKTNRNKKKQGKVTSETRTNHKESEGQQQAFTDKMKLQLSQLQNFSPCVVLEEMQTNTSICMRTRNQTKMKQSMKNEMNKNNVLQEKFIDETKENDSSHYSKDITNPKVVVDLYQYLVHRKSGFYQLPDESVTASRVEGRPKRTRRPPKVFIQAAYIPELERVKRTTRFKPEKEVVKDIVRKGDKHQNIPSSNSYNLRSATRSENTSKVSLLPHSSCSPKSSRGKKSNSIKGSRRTRKPLEDVTENVNAISNRMDEVKQTKQKVIPKKKVAKRLDYENMLPEDGVGNVNVFFNQSQVCISDNTISGVSVNKTRQDEVKEEDTYINCLINNKSVDVKCFSKMASFENSKSAVTAIPIMRNRSHNSEFTSGHIRILPNKKLFVEVNKNLFASYTVIKGKGVSKVSNKTFPLEESDLLYVPMGVSYFIHNNGTTPLILQYTIYSKLP